MPTGTGTSCYTRKFIEINGSLIENQDGSVSIFVTNTQQNLVPVHLTSYCCEILGYTFDEDTQKCMWSKKQECSIENTFNIELNPSGNDGTLFIVEENQTCELNVKFDYLFKISCETLNDFLLSSANSPYPTYDQQTLLQIIGLQGVIQQQEALCETIQNTITHLNTAIENTPYSILCKEVGSQESVVLPSQATQIIRKTAFSKDNITERQGTENTVKSGLTSSTLCIIEPLGLSAWSAILGPVNYQNFLNGDPESYDCDDFNQIFTQSQTSVSNGNGPLVVECDVPFGSRTELELSLSDAITQQIECNNTLQSLYNQLSTLTATTGTELGRCINPIDMFENLDVSMAVSVYSGGSYVTVYEDDSFFPTIGAGNLYNYLTTNTPSAFYVCGGDDCQPMNLNTSQFIGENTTTCDSVLDNLLETLFQQSGLSNTPADVNTFIQSLPINSFTSTWGTYNTTINDPIVLSAITNQKIKINLRLNHSCGDICILIDNIELNKNCETVSRRDIFVTECPGFTLEKIIDNKKSWLNNTTRVNRDFKILNASNVNPIRQTNYDVDDERLIINTKEIDLDVNIASAIETDVWNYILDNPCLLTGVTFCDPCANNKQFQDDYDFEFMDGYSYEFMDSQANNGSLPSTCCGDDKLDFNALMTQPLSAVTVLEDFQYYSTSELIDAKNRQTISSYPTLRALYDRYIQSTLYCDAQSSAFNYITIDEFAGLIGNYWVDIIEQVVPATTIWGSVKVYTNTLFDQQKFKYRSYSSLLCGNPFSGDTILSPINGTSGQCQSVEVITEVIPLSATSEFKISKSQISTCDTVCIAQMNHGSEFIGGVNIISVTPTSCSVTGQVVVDCSLGVTITTDGLTATAEVVNATPPITYNWSNGSTGQTATFLSTGVYSILVTDGNCCEVKKPVIIN